MGVISDRYHRRVAAVGRERLQLANQMRGVLKKALQEATKEELYDRTPLPVTHAMMNSIVTKAGSDTGDFRVDVYYAGSVAEHAKYRVNMRGISPSGGHVLNMQPSVLIKKKADPEIKRLARAAQRKILKGE